MCEYVCRCMRVPMNVFVFWGSGVWGDGGGGGGRGVLKLNVKPQENGSLIKNASRQGKEMGVKAFEF